ncbi:MAG TPA: 4'-phosphopantetheinyl transferase superfamily protein [Polyangiaceae bacterium]|nr:4'-phosphopantetheinyl transferase superfamily protein [Polyangiaceae bacterium]
MTDALVAGIFPDDIAVVWDEIGDVTAELRADEAAFVAAAVPKRQREFARGRVCARRALASLGVAAGSVLVGARREPLWPAGVVGSITHDDTLCLVALGRVETYGSIGIDIEPDAPLEPNVAARIWSPAEADASHAAGLDPALGARLAFCAKEAFYKCQFPLTRTFLGFVDAAVTLEPERFEVTLRVAAGALPPGTRFRGHWRRGAGKLFAALVLPRELAPR